MATIPKKINDTIKNKIKNNDDNFIIFSLDDENIDNLGKIIGVKYARDFLKICHNEELNLKEIAKRIEQNDNPRLPNTTHHKNRLQSLGLITTKVKRQRKKGHKLKYYKSKKIIIIVPEEIAQEINNNPKLKNEIKNLFKLMSFGIIALAGTQQLFLEINLMGEFVFQNNVNVVTLSVGEPFRAMFLGLTIARIVYYLIMERIKVEIRYPLNYNYIILNYS